jgi:hypothetical protein
LLRFGKQQEAWEMAKRQPPQRVPSELNAVPVGKNPAAVALGRLGGLKGGPARARKLSKEQRSEIARKAAEARWKSQD